VRELLGQSLPFVPVLVIVRVFGFSLSWKVESRGHDKIDLQTEDVLISSRTATVLRNPELYQLAHQGGRQGFVCRKPDCTLAGIVVLKFILHGLYYGAGVEGAVVRGGTIGHKQLPVQAKSGQLVTDALFGLWRRGFDALPKRLERGSLVRSHGGEISIGAFWFA